MIRLYKHFVSTIKSIIHCASRNFESYFISSTCTLWSLKGFADLSIIFTNFNGMTYFAVT